MRPKITLDAWAALRFNPPPARNTLRLWVRQGRIVPAPVKIGRAYFVEQDALHIAEVADSHRLVNRLKCM